MGSGGTDIVGVRNTSRLAKNRATSRLYALGLLDGRSQSAAATRSPASHSARLSGSISIGPGSRPTRRIQ